MYKNGVGRRWRVRIARQGCRGGMWSRSIVRSVLCFFFQAEDGIRDYKVTGVQTCALPILVTRLVEIARWHSTAHQIFRARRDSAVPQTREGVSIFGLTPVRLPDPLAGAVRKIGRASCRERG